MPLGGHLFDHSTFFNVNLLGDFLQSNRPFLNSCHKRFAVFPLFRHRLFMCRTVRTNASTADRLRCAGIPTMSSKTQQSYDFVQFRVESRSSNPIRPHIWGTKNPKMLLLNPGVSTRVSRNGKSSLWTMCNERTFPWFARLQTACWWSSMVSQRLCITPWPLFNQSYETARNMR